MAFDPPKYLTNLIASINDGAKTAQTSALSFAFIGLYLLTVAFSTTDEDLLREQTIVISQLGIAVPVVFSFAVAPLIFVFLHIHTLIRYDMLAANLRQFVRELAGISNEKDQERCRHLLANVEFLRGLTARPATPLTSRLFHLMSWFVLNGFPLFVLTVIQLSALRYQDEGIIWAQRTAIVADTGALIWFARRKWRLWEDNELHDFCALLVRSFDRVFGFAVLLGLLAFNFAWMGIPSPDTMTVGYTTIEGWREKLKTALRENPEKSPILFGIWEQPVDLGLCLLRFGCRYLRVPHTLLMAVNPSAETLAHLGHLSCDESGNGLTGKSDIENLGGLNLRGRTLRFVDLEGSRLYAAALGAADLRSANLSSTQLQGADLTLAKLQGANLFGARLQGAILHSTQLQGADLTLAKLQCADLALAHLESSPGDIAEDQWSASKSSTRTDLRSAQLQQADLSSAQLQQANLTLAQLQANLRFAQLQGADLTLAQLQGADLTLAQLQGANLFSARLQGADLTLAKLQGANLFDAKLQGAILHSAQLQGANLFEAYLQGASLFDARLQGANLRSAKLQGADLRSAWLQGADLALAQLQGADIRGAEVWQVTFGHTETPFREEKGDLSLSDLRSVRSRVPTKEERDEVLKGFDAIPDAAWREEVAVRVEKTLMPHTPPWRGISGVAVDKFVLVDDLRDIRWGTIGQDKKTVDEVKYDCTLAPYLGRLAETDEFVAKGIAERFPYFRTEAKHERTLWPDLARRLLDGRKGGKIKLPNDVTANLESYAELSSIINDTQRPHTSPISSKRKIPSSHQSK